MKRIHTMWLIVLIALACSSCGTTNVLADKSAKVRKGMKMEEVRKIFGKPDFIRFDDYAAVWEYRKYMPMEGAYSVVVIMFDGKERVRGMDTFFEPYINANTKQTGRPPHARH